ncbi:nucleotidyltransferase [Gluconobacter oxydans H24]|nr:nucleotidyltransferase [Gluconobacter oxydans H24]
MRGEGTYLSDIDLVVIYDHLEAAYRESFVVGDMPIEAFVHDRETLAWFVKDDVSRGRPSILNMIAEGQIIGREYDRAVALRREMSDLLAKGPPPLSSSGLNALRYELTDAVDDLRGNRTLQEVIAIGASLHPRLVELALRGRGHWNGTGKWAPRLLREIMSSWRTDSTGLSKHYSRMAMSIPSLSWSRRNWRPTVEHCSTVTAALRPVPGA